mmetsp:Transcript_129662/g.276607  ORF Transcript_129662/g.276607 Transcript_129662/m.276607 type:complete len:220 (-) Transcript_129662:473-1132(-)
MRRTIELKNVQGAVVELQDRALVVVNVAIIRRREDRDHRREARGWVGLVHLVAFELGLMRSDHRQKRVLLEELVGSLKGEEVRTTAHLVGYECRAALLGLHRRLVVLRIIRIGPQDVAQQALAGGLLEAVHAADRLQVGEVGGEAAMHCQELSVDRRCQRQGVKRVHESVVDILVVLVLALLPKVEEAGHLAALVIAAQHPNSFGVQDLVSEEESHSLD